MFLAISTTKVIAVKHVVNKQSNFFMLFHEVFKTTSFSINQFTRKIYIIHINKNFCLQRYAFFLIICHLILQNCIALHFCEN